MDDVTRAGRLIIRQGSKSFALAAALFDRACREDAYQLYAWCRHCDDVIDGQTLGHAAHGNPGDARTSPAERLARLRNATERAIAGAPDDDPVFVGLARVVQRHGIPAHQPRDLLEGFAMDVRGRTFVELDDCLDYCYHVAGVVGLMMARIMGVRDDEALHRACDLGIAFQLTNIVRDVVADADVGRLYLPSRWLDEEGLPADEVAAPHHRHHLFRVAIRLLDEADRYYASSRWGLAALAPRRAWAIATARGVYREIGQVVRRRGARAWDGRPYVETGRKALLAARGGLDVLSIAAATAMRRNAAPRPLDLWTRPRSASPT